MIFNHIFEAYALLCISVIIHELAHIIAGKVIHLNIEKIHIGDDLFSIHIKKLYLSVIMFSGSYISFCSDELISKKKSQIIFFFLSGPFSNLLLVIVARVCRNIDIFYMDIIFWINLYFWFENIFPFFLKENDAGKLRRYLKQKAK